MIGDKLTYPYIITESPKNKINYSYSKYRGIEFIEAWRKSRPVNKGKIMDVNCIMPESHTLAINPEQRNSIVYLSKMIFNLTNSNFEISNEILLLIKRFEVYKKVFTTYDENFRPVDKRDYNNGKAYALFGILMSLIFLKYDFLQALNSAIKVNDIILGANFNKNNQEIINLSLVLETEAVEKLIKEKLIV